jgi:ribosomal-protein-alanine N-acetyltransferase
VGEIETERLTLTALTAERAHAALHDHRRLSALLGVRVPPSWPGEEFAGALPIIAKGLHHDPTFADWTALIVHREDRTLIGEVGFKSTPDSSGTIEIGYGVLPDYRRQGIATEAVRAMIDRAFADDAVQRVIANCLNDNLGSICVLEHVGMHRAGRSGPLLDWEIWRADRLAAAE